MPVDSVVDVVEQEVEDNTEEEVDVVEATKNETTMSPLQIQSTYTEIPHPPEVPLYGPMHTQVPTYPYPPYPYPHIPTYSPYGQYTWINVINHAPLPPTYNPSSYYNPNPFHQSESGKAKYGPSNPYWPYSTIGNIPYPQPSYTLPYPQYPGNPYPVYYPTQDDITAYFPQKG